MLSYCIRFHSLYVFVKIFQNSSSLFFNVELSVSPLNVIVVFSRVFTSFYIFLTIENRKKRVS